MGSRSTNIGITSPARIASMLIIVSIIGSCG